MVMMIVRKVLSSTNPMASLLSTNPMISNAHNIRRQFSSIFRVSMMQNQLMADIDNNTNNLGRDIERQTDRIVVHAACDITANYNNNSATRTFNEQHTNNHHHNSYNNRQSSSSSNRPSSSFQYSLPFTHAAAHHL